MATISANKEIKASIETVWNIVSDVDSDPQYWHGTRSIKNIRKEGNKVERETVIAFKESKCKEIITFEDKNKIVTEISEGPMQGKKTIWLEKINENLTRVNVIWSIHMKGALGLFTFMVKKHILNGTNEALDRIAEKAENNSSPQI